MLFKKALNKISLVLREASAKKIIASYALIGGMAVSAWGVIRATKDVDFLLCLANQNSALREFEKILKKHKIKFSTHKGAFNDPIGLLLNLQIPIAKEKVSIQLIVATKDWEEEFSKATVKVKVGAINIPVIKAEELIIMKMIAGGPVDIYDVKQLLKANKNGQSLNSQELREKSRKLRLEDKLNKIMDEKETT